ncbi:ABC transporter ATP-binding protein [Paenibacillus psychroresistens]|uniref:ABC transporter ATP-binding protein n=1 Tax=Paenibacillus psychroresistens TaxID=1778678 RepID=A0A6B8RSV4_9BACL|nr:ABC transporter ATP-binding protein [Paenibacillus psychroresistens]QGQ99520.1 ABC transporter ATP-binding protein [Paenibacillus psychroresistens]
MSLVLEVNGLSKKIGDRTIVNNISFSVNRGEIFGLLGPNGAGKTTTIRMLVGLARSTEGTISICGHDIHSDHRNALKNVGTIVENPELYPYLSGLENLRQFARLSGPIDEAKIAEVVKIVGLEDRIGEKVKRYSLGMRQRLGLGQALIHNPALLILDEPTNGLDPSGIREFRQLLLNLAAQGTSILISSHLLAELEQIVDRVGVIHQGKWIITSTLDELRNQSNLNRLILHVDSVDNALLCLKTEHPKLNLRHETMGQLILEEPPTVLNPILSSLLQAGVQIYKLEEQKSSLEDVFLTMTGGHEHG